jgi:hypothetical protein
MVRGWSRGQRILLILGVTGCNVIADDVQVLNGVHYSVSGGNELLERCQAGDSVAWYVRGTGSLS